MNPNSICLQVMADFIFVVQNAPNGSPVPTSSTEAWKRIINGVGTFHDVGNIPLVHIFGIMDQNDYKSILEDHMLTYACKKMPRERMF